MSLAVEKLETVRVDEPRIEIGEKREYAILDGGQQVSWKPVTSTSYSDNNIQFSAPPPSPAIIVDRKMYIRYGVQFKFTSIAAVTSFMQIGFQDALRAFPLSSCMSTLTVTLNNTQVSVNMSDVLHPLLRYHNDIKQRGYDYSLCPSMLDQNANYQGTSGSNRNPLGNYQNGNSEDFARGGFPIHAYQENAANPAVTYATYIITEPLFLSPFIFGRGENSGFIGLQTMDFNFTLNNLSHMWSSFNPNLASVSASLVGDGTMGNPGSPTAPQLLFNYITPKSLMSIPKEVAYPYFVVDRYPTDLSSIAAGATLVNVSTANIQLNSIPRRIYIYARPSNGYIQSNPVTTSDCFFEISGVIVNWANHSGLLSSSTEQDLFRLSCDNGLDMSYQQWSYTQGSGPAAGTTIGTVGSVLCLEFGKDIGLDSTEAPGQLGTFQLQLQVSVTNNFTQSFTALQSTLYVAVVSEGTFLITQNRSVAQIGVISKTDVITSRQQSSVDYSTVEKVQGSGDFYSSLRSMKGRRKHKASDGGVLIGGASKSNSKGSMHMSRKELKKHLDRM